MRSGVLLFLCGGALLTVDTSARGQTDASRVAELPRVVLIGDSIRLGYAPRVAELLSGRAVVISLPENGGDSGNVLAHLNEWVDRQKPDVVHLNCGLHDLKRFKTNGHHQVELDRYTVDLRQIRHPHPCRDRCRGLVFANTTPILDERHARRGADFDRTEADVRRYNAAATAIMNEMGVPVHDLHWVVEQGNSETMLGPDGTHYTAAGSDRLAEAVADCVLRQLTVRRYRPLVPPASGPEAAAEYRRAAARRDVLIPDIPAAQGRRIPHPSGCCGMEDAAADGPSDCSRVAWRPPSRPAPPRARTMSRELRRGYTLEKVSLANGVDSDVTALLLLPEDRRGPVPAILWLHSSTPDKTQVIIPGTNGGLEPLGETFVRAGYAVPRSRLVLAWRPRRHRTVRHNGAGEGRGGRPIQAQHLAWPYPLGHVRPGRSGSARLPLHPPRSGRFSHRGHRHEHGQHPCLVARRRGRARRGRGGRCLPDPLREI